MHTNLLDLIAALYVAMFVFWSVGVNKFQEIGNIYISLSKNWMMFV